MIKDSPIVADTRKVRKAISAQFDHDIDKYIDHLQGKSDTQKSDGKHAKREKVKH